MPRTRRLTLRTLLALWVAAFGGCATQSPGSRLEHHVAAHKPVSFADAVQQIQLRHDAIFRKYQSAPETLDRELSEMLDIIRWLPELAGDSALKKRDWNRVQDAGTELLSQYELVQKGVHHTPRGNWPADEKRVAELSESLAKLVASSEGTY